MESPKRGCDLGPCVLKTLAFKKRIAIVFLRVEDFPRGQGLRSGRLRSENAAFCVCVSKPAKSPTLRNKVETLKAQDLLAKQFAGNTLGW